MNNKPVTMPQLLMAACIIFVLSTVLSTLAVRTTVASLNIDGYARQVAYAVSLIGHPEADVHALMEQRMRISLLRTLEDNRSYRDYTKESASPSSVQPRGRVLVYHIGSELSGAKVYVFLDRKGTVFAVHIARDDT